MLTKAVFFDRDDTLIQDTGYMYKIADFKWMDGALPALSLLRDAHIPIFIATNQGGIGKGLFTLEQMQHFHNHLRAEALNRCRMPFLYRFALLFKTIKTYLVALVRSFTVLAFQVRGFQGLCKS